MTWWPLRNRRGLPLGPRGNTMKKLFSIASICAAVLIAAGAAAPVKAATIVATWTGQITNGADYGNNFGGFNVGDAVTVKSVFDTSTGTLAGNTITGGGKATLTINGNDFDFVLPSSSYGLNTFGSMVLAEDDAPTFLHAGGYTASLPTSILTAFDGNIDSGYGF